MALTFQVPLARRAAAKQRRQQALAVMVVLVPIGVVAHVSSLATPFGAFAGAGTKISPLQGIAESRPWIRHANGAHTAAITDVKGANLVGFGKHKDLTIAQLCQQEPDYVLWLRERDDISPRAAAVLHYADSMGSASPGSQSSSVDDEERATHQDSTGSASPGMPTASLDAEERATDQDWESMHEQLVGFGKYAETQYREVYEEHSDYIDWLRRQNHNEPSTSSEQAMKLIGYANHLDGDISSEERLERMHEIPVGFGKHATMSFKMVYEEHHGYITWLRSQRDAGDAVTTQCRGLIEYADYMDRSLPPRERLGCLGRQTVGFGKYKDLTIEKLYDEDYEYVQWLCTREEITKGRDIVDYAALRKEMLVADRPSLQKFLEQRGHAKVGFGKHKELTFVQLYKDEPQYIEWLRAQTGFPVAMPVVEYADLMDREQLQTAGAAVVS